MGATTTGERQPLNPLPRRASLWRQGPASLIGLCDSGNSPYQQAGRGRRRCDLSCALAWIGCGGQDVED
eukprot:2705090-Rhodomonas_salina.1